MTQACADPTFGLSSQALAILQLLSQIEPEFATWNETARQWRIEIRTFPWYNGLERGVAIVMRKDSKCREHLVIAFGEDRTTDQVFVQQWVSDEALPNGPTARELEERESRNLTHRKEFPPLNYAEVVEHVRDTMSRFYDFQETLLEKIP